MIHAVIDYGKRVAPVPAEYQSVRKFMRERAEYLASMERTFPAYRKGMSTRQYVNHYYFSNRGDAAPFSPEEITYLKKVQP